jgi:hypothetical protein
MKTSELTGAALDWAVAKCAGAVGTNDRLAWYTPSTNWHQGGAIIECEKISLWSRGNEWAAESFTPNEQGHEETGKTPLVAAMRCYVASKMGDDVTVPEELQGETA